jgi:polysaccharide pyruvyl transferase WcaK-like protein
MGDYSNNIIFCQAEIPFANQGDLVINKVLITKLRTYGKLIVNDRNVPEWYCQQLELSNEERVTQFGMRFPYLILFWALKALLQPQINIYLMLRPGHFYGYEFRLAVKMFLATLYYFLLKILGVRVCRLGTSIGSFSKPLQWVENLRARAMYFYSVRDTISKDYALKIGIDCVRLFPDLAWLIKKKDSSDRLTWLMQTPNEQPTQQLERDSYIVFSFRDSFREFNGSEYKEKLFKKLDEIINLISKTWSKKLVICYQVKRDYKFSKELKQRYQSCCDVIFIERYIDSSSMYELYSGATMVCSNRLHVLMFAMLCDSLPIAVIDADKEEKITGILTDAGLQKFILDLDKNASIANILSDLVANSSQIKNEITLAFDRHQNQAEMLLKNILSGEISYQFIEAEKIIS